MTARAVLLAAALVGALSSCGSRDTLRNHGLRTISATDRVEPTRPSAKPTFGGIDWQRDRAPQVYQRLKRTYLYAGRTRDRRVETYLGKTYGRPSMVRLDYMPDGLVGKVTVIMLDGHRLWRTYAEVRDVLTQRYGPSAAIAEPTRVPGDATLARLASEGRAPGTYWYFRKSGYTAAVLMSRPMGRFGTNTLVTVEFEPPDWDPDVMNTRPDTTDAAFRDKVDDALRR